MTKFKDVPVGTEFRFDGEVRFPFSGIATGPWVKISELQYKRPDARNTEALYRVGTKMVMVHVMEETK